MHRPGPADPAGVSDPPNPYAPPRSDVVPAGAGDAPGIGWRLYSGLIALLMFAVVALMLLLAWDLAYTHLFLAYGLVGVDPEMGAPGIGESTGSLLFVLPVYYALFRYGWRSPELWRA